MPFVLRLRSDSLPAGAAIAFVLALFTVGQWMGQVDGAEDKVPHEEGEEALVIDYDDDC